MDGALRRASGDSVQGGDSDFYGRFEDDCLEHRGQYGRFAGEVWKLVFGRIFWGANDEVVDLREADDSGGTISRIKKWLRSCFC